ncbi:hypothetical protein JCM8097_000951 [Rhodosporidiobolus ruineniae]
MRLLLALSALSVFTAAHAQLLVPDQQALLALAVDQHLVDPSSALPTPTAVPTQLPADPEQFHQAHLYARQNTNSQSSSSSVSIPNTAAAGGLTYLTPAATAQASYYKIASGNAITFGWNYTSLYVTPTSLTFEARCSANGNTYPVGTVAGSETSLVWDPWAYQQSPNAVPFAQASYTLRVYDERGADATAQAGMFNGANSIVNFAMYSPAAYTPLSQGWTCAGCSAAAGRVLGSPVVVSLVVVVAVGLIGGGAGVLGR